MCFLLVAETFMSRFCKLPCGGIGVDSDTVWNEAFTPLAARMVCGSPTIFFYILGDILAECVRGVFKCVWFKAADSVIEF